MAVTEAQMAGVVPAVTRYASAQEQITNGEDGYIFDNSDEGIYAGLNYLVQHAEDVKGLKQKVWNTNFGNENEIKIFDACLEELQN